MSIRFNLPHLVGSEIDCIEDALSRGRLAGGGHYTRKCSTLMEQYLSVKKALLTHSCTAALEMAAILAELKPGDEVILPSYTFVSTANAFVLRGAIPVFADIRPDTLNLDERNIESLITSNTKVIVPVHYAGVGCDMHEILKIASKHNLLVIEDAAQAYGSTYRGKMLGTFGDFGAFSFHETKNILCGEGGALVLNNPKYIKRAEIIWDKGTDRAQFFRGEIDKYSWVDLGSSYLPGEIIAAFLYPQLQMSESINASRMEKWKNYYSRFKELRGIFKLPEVPTDCGHNAHLFYLLARTHDEQVSLLNRLKEEGVNAVFHYVPLHLSVAAKKFNCRYSDLKYTEQLSERLIRLPLYPDLSNEEQDKVIDVVTSWATKLA